MFLTFWKMFNLGYFSSTGDYCQFEGGWRTSKSAQNGIGIFGSLGSLFKRFKFKMITKHRQWLFPHDLKTLESFLKVCKQKGEIGPNWLDFLLAVRLYFYRDLFGICKLCRLISCNNSYYCAFKNTEVCNYWHSYIEIFLPIVTKFSIAFIWLFCHNLCECCKNLNYLTE